MVVWHHRLNGHEFEQALGVGGGQGSLTFCSPWGRKESDTTEHLSTAQYSIWQATLIDSGGCYIPCYVLIGEILAN